MTRAISVKGTVPFGRHRTWYRITGIPGSTRPALVTLHGGPGATHDYLQNLAWLAESGWPVVHYDQIGNGGSSHLPDKGADFWTVQLFLDELDNLLRALAIDDNYLLFGHSWGGMLAAKHASARPPGLKGLIIANSPASYELWLGEMKALREDLPPGVNDTLLRHESAGTTGTDEYLQASMAFYDKHVCRIRPWPKEYTATFMEIYNDSTVYLTMNGPTEFHVVGTLKDWSVTDCAADIAVPTLLVSGRHDEATPATVRPFAELIPDVRWEIFEHSSHVPNLEEPDRFREVVGEFLKQIS
ncbi:proline iminopeptidase-family hydrolase [Streptosporangium sp. DT93]|uniref:proline iminopeptidase-family hydrolase n=1 Tax=Streptosporangium sp. DT93 TaxID=3393428 RepID=UPI003CF59169